MLGQVRRS